MKKKFKSLFVEPEEMVGLRKKIEELGGVIPAIKANFFQKEIAKASYKYQQEVENQEKIIVGVNQFKLTEEITTPLLKIDEKIAEEQVNNLNKVRQKRDNEKLKEKLEKLKEAAKGSDNLMPYIIDAVREYASAGEIMNVLKEVFGIYIEDSIF